MPMPLAHLARRPGPLVLDNPVIQLWEAFCILLHALCCQAVELHAVVFRWLARAVDEVCFIEHAISCYDIWHGLVDAYFPAVHMAMQFDGKQHQEGQRMYKQEHGKQLQKDIAFNEHMWAAGVRVMRMHHTDGGENGRHTVHKVLDWCRQHPGCKLLVLSYKFQAMYIKVQGTDVPYCDYMASKLGAQCKHDQYGRAWLWEQGVLAPT